MQRNCAFRVCLSFAGCLNCCSFFVVGYGSVVCRCRFLLLGCLLRSVRIFIGICRERNAQRSAIASATAVESVLLFADAFAMRSHLAFLFVL